PNLVVPPAPKQRISLALGHGDTLRPVVLASQPDIPVSPPFPNPNLMLWKLTYQTCKETSTGPAYGPEKPLEDPSVAYGHGNVFYLSLDTLFQGDQDVALRAYDRQGAVNTTAFHLVTATALPTFLVTFNGETVRPAVVYQDIPFQLNVLVHSRV